MIRKVLSAMLRDCHSSGLSEHTIDYYRSQCTIFADYCEQEGIPEIENVTTDLIRGFLIQLQEEGYSEGGIHAKFRAVKVLMNWFQREYEPENWKNPILKVKPPKVPEQLIEPITFEQVEKLLQDCDNSFSGIRDYAYMLFLLDTGARLEESINVLLEDVDFYSGEILIRRGKGGRGRYVYIGKKTTRAIKKYIKNRVDSNPSLWVTSMGTTLVKHSVQTKLAERCKRVGIPVQSPHDFRKAFTTMMAGETDIFNLMKLSGHKSMDVLKKHYVARGRESARAAYERGSPVDKSLA